MTIKRCLLLDLDKTPLEDVLWEQGEEFCFDYRIKENQGEGLYLVEVEGELANLEAWANYYDIEFEED